MITVIQYFHATVCIKIFIAFRDSFTFHYFIINCDPVLLVEEFKVKDIEREYREIHILSH